MSSTLSLFDFFTIEEVILSSILITVILKFSLITSLIKRSVSLLILVSLLFRPIGFPIAIRSISQFSTILDNSSIKFVFLVSITFKAKEVLDFLVYTAKPIYLSPKSIAKMFTLNHFK